jgi:hypothetical protein
MSTMLEEEKLAEGKIARAIESRTAQLPSDVFFGRQWAPSPDR